MSKKRTPHRYDVAFKEGAIKLVTEQGRTVCEVARELGISPDSLRNWLKATGISIGETNRLNKEARRIKELEAQVRDLKKLVSDKDETIDVLKKSVGIFSKP